MQTDKNVYIWGNGSVVRRYIDQIPNDIKISAIIDSNKMKWGSTELVHNEICLMCIEDNLTENDFVIIAIENPQLVEDIGKMLENRHIEYCHIFQVVDEAFLKSERIHTDIKEAGLMMKFVDVMLPTAKCNMKCEYCYLSHLKVELNHVSDFYHDARYIRYALSQERLGGSAFINLCGVGETLLYDGIVDVVDELIKEGHYVQIVTNATLTNVIKKFIQSKIDSKKLFFKCSLHYEELTRLHLLDRFAENVTLLDKWGASFSVEYVPMDSSIELIPEIKNYCIKNFGALPHVTVTRDERTDDYRILSNLSREDYVKIWQDFNSDLFDFKMNNMDSKGYGKCYAGMWAVELNLATGELYKCTNNPRLGNIYQNLDKKIDFEEVGDKCCLPYCFNNHAYLTLGLMPDVNTSTYLQMRDRIKSNGEHWIKDTMRAVFSQKLCENNNG